MGEFVDIVGDFDFNREDDKGEFGADNRVVTLNRFNDDNKDKLGLSFTLGRKEDDTLTIVFDWKDLIFKLIGQ